MSGLRGTTALTQQRVSKTDVTHLEHPAQAADRLGVEVCALQRGHCVLQRQSQSIQLVSQRFGVPLQPVGQAAHPLPQALAHGDGCRTALFGV